MKAKTMFPFTTKSAVEATDASVEKDLTSDVDIELRDAAKAADRARKQFNAKASEYANGARDKIRDFADQARHDLNKAADQASGHVRGNAMQSALIMLGVGFVLGMVLRGSRRI